MLGDPRQHFRACFFTIMECKKRNQANRDGQEHDGKCHAAVFERQYHTFRL